LTDEQFDLFEQKLNEYKKSKGLDKLPKDLLDLISNRY
jgi:hypothetical protein